jgi:hypothetical protein
LAAAAGSGQAVLTWTNPADADFQGVMIRRSTGSAPSATTDGALVYNANGTTFPDMGLIDGTRYYYTAFAYDTVPNYSSGVSDDVVPSPGTPVEISFAGVGPRGIFDPSLALDPGTGRIWMSYSEVRDSVMWPGQNTVVQTRLAWSDDAGANWSDAGIQVNLAQDVILPLAPPNNAGSWIHEVPTIVFDPGAPANERWKIVWHRYLQVNGVQHFEHGWIAMKTASAPAGPWSLERKLFTGSLYDPINDTIIGPPEVRLDQLDADLNFALVFSEPGLVATADSLYVAILAAGATSPDQEIVLVKLPHASGVWEYKGALLTNAQDGPFFGVDGFSAPELYLKDSTHYLLVTPQTSDLYSGTYGFAILDLENATIERSGGLPVPILQHMGTAGSHNGATGYIPEATASGFIYSEALPTLPLFFRIYASRLNL